MKITLRRMSCAVYGLSFFVIAVLSVFGELGQSGINSVVDLVLVGWLAGYASILILLVGGTAHAAYREILKITYKKREVTVQ